ncbi:hypothetical protein ACIGO8_03035 [Streptomyces sp. NPDC053493]|uniref:hypothetical protein n=1 Tax=Streptomyces sp. NPDC053493 TaxID=3365705 RepID=UPI0037D4C0D5
MTSPIETPALIAHLRSDNSTVREWAAMALASLEIDDAIAVSGPGPGPDWELDWTDLHPER